MIARFVAALAGAPFGLKGFIKINSLSGETGHLIRLESVTLRINGHEKVYTVEETIRIAPSIAMKFKGIDSPEAAKTLGGAELIIDRADAAPLKTGEFYIEDLKGLAVVLPHVESTGNREDSEPDIPSDPGQNAGILGYINDVVEGGGGFLVEVRLPTGELKFIPFLDEFFGDITIETGRAVLLKPWILE